MKKIESLLCQEREREKCYIISEIHLISLVKDNQNYVIERNTMESFKLIKKNSKKVIRNVYDFWIKKNLVIVGIITFSN